MTTSASQSQNKQATKARSDAMDHVRGLLDFIGEDPTREGLIETPRRVLAAMKDHFRGYHEDPASFLGKSFTEVEGYQGVRCFEGCGESSCAARSL